MNDTVYALGKLTMVGRKADLYNIDGKAAWLPHSLTETFEHRVGLANIDGEFLIKLPKWLAKNKEITTITAQECREIKKAWELEKKEHSEWVQSKLAPRKASAEAGIS